MTAYGRNRITRMDMRESLCGDKRCKDRAKLGIDTRPRVHAVTSHGRDLVATYEMMAHPFVIGGGNASQS